MAASSVSCVLFMLCAPMVIAVLRHKRTQRAVFLSDGSVSRDARVQGRQGTQQALFLADGSVNADTYGFRHMEKQGLAACDEISASYATKGNHGQFRLCMELLANGANPACCYNNECCADGDNCKLIEVYSALGMDCPASLEEGEARQEPAPGGMSCEDIAKQFNHDKPDSEESMCHDIDKDGGAAGCCSSNTCCADKKKCTLAETYEALGKDCSVDGDEADSSNGERDGHIDCVGVEAKFAADGHDQKTVCADERSQGADPGCCTSETKPCCANQEHCTLPEIYRALQMKCPSVDPE